MSQNRPNLLSPNLMILGSITKRVVLKKKQITTHGYFWVQATFIQQVWWRSDQGTERNIIFHQIWSIFCQLLINSCSIPKISMLWKFCDKSTSIHQIWLRSSQGPGRNMNFNQIWWFLGHLLAIITIAAIRPLNILQRDNSYQFQVFFPR